MDNFQENNGSNNNLINNQVQGDNNIIYIDHLHSVSSEPKRTIQKPVKLFGKHVKTKWFSITGIAAFLASLVTIYSGFKPLFDGIFPKNEASPFSNYFLMALMLTWMAALYFIQVFRNSILIIGKHKVAEHKGELYFEEYEANCPQCGSKLKPIFSIKHGLSYMYCKLYPAHSLRFNPKIFDKDSYQ